MQGDYAPDLSTKQRPLFTWSAVVGAKIMTNETGVRMRAQDFSRLIQITQYSHCMAYRPISP